MQKRYLHVTVSIAIWAVLLCGDACAAVYYQEEWTTDPGWLIRERDDTAGLGTLTYIDSGSTLDGRDSLLRIDGPNAPGILEDIIYAGAGTSGFIQGSSFTNSEYVSFMFYASIAPQQLDVFFMDGSGNKWFNKIDSVTVGSWAIYELGMAYSSDGGWYKETGFGSYGDFQLSVADVDEVGIMIWYQSSTPGQVFGLDNYYVIPEPGTYLMLGFAFLSLAVTFRRQLNEAIA